MKVVMKVLLALIIRVKKRKEIKIDKNYIIINVTMTLLLALIIRVLITEWCWLGVPTHHRTHHDYHLHHHLHHQHLHHQKHHQKHHQHRHHHQVSNQRVLLRQQCIGTKDKDHFTHSAIQLSPRESLLQRNQIPNNTEARYITLPIKTPTSYEGFPQKLFN